MYCNHLCSNLSRKAKWRMWVIYLEGPKVVARHCSQGWHLTIWGYCRCPTRRAANRWLTDGEVYSKYRNSRDSGMKMGSSVMSTLRWFLGQMNGTSHWRFYNAFNICASMARLGLYKRDSRWRSLVTKRFGFGAALEVKLVFAKGKSTRERSNTACEPGTAAKKRISFFLIFFFPLFVEFCKRKFLWTSWHEILACW